MKPGFFAEADNQKVVTELMNAGIHWPDPMSAATTHQPAEDHAYFGKTFVISGSLDSMSRDAAAKTLSDLGAKVTSSVSKKTYFLLVGDKPGSKLKKAETLGIAVLNEAEWLKALPQQ